MRVLVVGASGATGRLVVSQLLERGAKVKAIIRTLDGLPDHPNLYKIQACVHDLTSSDMALYVKDCNAVICCLGHNLSFTGIFGKPRLLVTDTIQCLCNAVKVNDSDVLVKFILMNTSGNSNRDLPEKPPLSQRIVIGILRALLPPHVDNENAADFLRTQIGPTNKAIEWAIVRPDALTNQPEVTRYNIQPSPIRNVIFDPGSSSRINVGNFMIELLFNDKLWLKWKGHMPVIYNQE
ncbi:MAG: hypothetical protein ACI9QV_001045 [Methylophagaceae bacterium]|jgi:hypothetical protein